MFFSRMLENHKYFHIQIKKYKKMNEIFVKNVKTSFFAHFWVPLTRSVVFLNLDSISFLTLWLSNFMLEN